MAGLREGAEPDFDDYTAPSPDEGWVDWAFDPRVRGVVFQVLLGLGLALFLYWIIHNTAVNLAKQQVASGFGFLDRIAGFDISQSLIDYTNTDTYGRAFLVGLLNTVFVALIGIVAATLLGFFVGIARLSSNWLVKKLAAGYVETIRNIPLLLQLFVWYFAVLEALPSAHASLALPGGVFINMRGFYAPRPIWQPGSGAVLLALLAGLALWLTLSIWAKRRQRATGERLPASWIGLAITIVLTLGAFLAAGAPVVLDYPHLGRFNIEGGIAVQPEFLALVIGLSVYTAAFIAEVVRAGIAGVPRGQSEAAAALGLTRGQALRLVVIPQAMRIIIPPLTNQYLNLTKNSSLAVAIGYPDLVSVAAGTILNQTSQAVEVIALTMAVYLGLSLLTAALMAWFNARVALVER